MLGRDDSSASWAWTEPATEDTHFLKTLLGWNVFREWVSFVGLAPVGDTLHSHGPPFSRCGEDSMASQLPCLLWASATSERVLDTVTSSSDRSSFAFSLWFHGSVSWSGVRGLCPRLSSCGLAVEGAHTSVAPFW